METEFDTVNKQIIHDFSNGCKIVTDLRTNTAYEMNTKGDLVGKMAIDTMLVSDYTEYIINIEKSMM